MISDRVDPYVDRAMCNRPGRSSGSHHHRPPGVSMYCTEPRSAHLVGIGLNVLIAIYACSITLGRVVGRAVSSNQTHAGGQQTLPDAISSKSKAATAGAAAIEEEADAGQRSANSTGDQSPMDARQDVASHPLSMQVRPSTPWKLDAWLPPLEVERDVGGSDIPNCFLCPLSMALMMDPVVTPAGITFERSAVVSWLERNHKDPASGQALKEQQLYPNLALRDMIHDWLVKSAESHAVQSRPSSRVAPDCLA